MIPSFVCSNFPHVPSFVCANFPHFGYLKMPSQRVWKFSPYLRPENVIFPRREIQVLCELIFLMYEALFEQIFRILELENAISTDF